MSKSMSLSAMSGASSSAIARTAWARSFTCVSGCWRSCSTLASESIWFASTVARSTVSLISRQRLPRLHVAAQRRLHLRLQHRERRAQLVRGVAHEALLVLQQVRQPAHHLVGGVHQRHAVPAARRGAPSGVRSPSVRACSSRLRRRTGRVARLHDQHDDQADHRHQRRLLPQDVEQDAARELAAQLQRFRDLHHRHAAAGGAGHRLQQHRHAHLHVAIARRRRNRPAPHTAAAPGCCRARTAGRRSRRPARPRRSETR